MNTRASLAVTAFVMFLKNNYSCIQNKKEQMKRTVKIFFTAIFGMFLFLNYTVQEEPSPAATSAEYTSADTVVIQYTGRIKAIIQEKCYECHSKDGDDEDAKKELLWDELPKLDKKDQVYTLDAIVESVENGDMPPAKHVRWNPKKKLTDEEAKLLMDWAKTLADQLYE